MSRVVSVLKYAAIALAVVLALAVALVAWLRYEFARVTAEASDLAAWYRTPVTALDEGLPAPAPCAQRYPQKKAWFGDLHVHTRASYDATSFGSLITADDAYRFATGTPLPLRLRGDAPGYEAPVARISAPLDFMAVTDHAEGLGEVNLCYDRASEAHDTLVCGLYRGDVQVPLVPERMQAIVRLSSMAVFGTDRSARVCGEDGSRCIERAELAWRQNQRSAEAWLDRSGDCAFTTFHAYEYSLAEESSNLHRNVIFAGATVPQAALSARDAPSPELLWAWLDQVCIEGDPACDVLAIPHNSNWSSGRMWRPSGDETGNLGERRQRAALRAKLEPLAEIYQVKGDSECRNGIASVVGAPDEFCDFEKLRPANEPTEDCGEEPGSGGMLLKGCISRYSYLRYALAAGLAEEAKLGVNPFRLGLIASTDTHNGTPMAGREQGNLGSHGTDREVQSRLLGTVDVPGDIARGSPVRYSPGGLAGVYAEENSRPALFAAMRRRETFGTSGPRIEPRFFAGWHLAEGLCERPDYLETAYRDGVPMGGELNGASRADGAPRFYVSATRDPREGAGLLQRIQIVKAWIDADGRTRQAVFDVAGDPHNGATVDRDTCAVSGTGFQQLCADWRDPQFDAATAAVYYARVLENPSCRWSRHDCIALPAAERPLSCEDPDLPWQIQERAWTSPIWYRPAG